MFLAQNFQNGMQNVGRNEPNTFRIDSGIKSAGTIPGLERVLGLAHIEDADAAAVAAINNERAAVSMKENAERQAEWKAEIEAKLTTSKFLGGEEPNDEDKHAYMMMNSFLNPDYSNKYAPVTEESHPCFFKWQASMDELKK